MCADILGGGKTNRRGGGPTGTSSFHPPKTVAGKVTLLSPFYRGGNRGSEPWDALLEAPELIRAGAGAPEPQLFGGFSAAGREMLTDRSICLFSLNLGMILRSLQRAQWNFPLESVQEVAFPKFTTYVCPQYRNELVNSKGSKGCGSERSPPSRPSAPGPFRCVSFERESLCTRSEHTCAHACAVRCVPSRSALFPFNRVWWRVGQGIRFHGCIVLHHRAGPR